MEENGEPEVVFKSNNNNELHSKSSSPPLTNLLTFYTSGHIFSPDLNLILSFPIHAVCFAHAVRWCWVIIIIIITYNVYHKKSRQFLEQVCFFKSSHMSSLPYSFIHSFRKIHQIKLTWKNNFYLSAAEGMRRWR